jgi:hypothetical protein
VDEVGVVGEGNGVNERDEEVRDGVETRPLASLPAVESTGSTDGETLHNPSNNLDAESSV